MSTQIRIPGLGWRDTVLLAVRFATTDEIAGYINFPALKPGEEDVIDCPLTLWASDNGLAVDDLYLDGEI